MHPQFTANEGAMAKVPTILPALLFAFFVQGNLELWARDVDPT